MRSRRVLGTIALLAIVAAVMSFAVVDLSTSAAQSCANADSCTVGDSETASWFAVVGVVALVVAAGSLLGMLFVPTPKLTDDAAPEP